ncbi:putative ribonuclease H-like domain-containing protein [Tanacetum coccineum]|uniref:Ribonuclease H-like domain-containing protein n=1 Tax=Tanacetum coccineum TaxID=301880 RepID=A0ABQ5D250_9ASTR
MHKKFQMSSMGELTFFLGLQVTQKDDGIFISQDKYVDEILKKFGFSTMKTTSTPVETSKPLLKDSEAEDVNVHLYRSMIGSLMYLTSLRPDIMFAVCACARFQVTPKVSHLNAVKRIFRYLKGNPQQEVVNYLDADDFLACKKQTVVANSTTEAEYVAAAMFLDKQVEGMSKHKEIYVTPSHTKKVFFANIDERRKEETTIVKQRKDTEVPQPSGSTEPITDEATNEEHVPIHSNDPLLSEITKLKERVKKLERRNKSRTLGLKRSRKVGRTARIESSKDEVSCVKEDASNMGRNNLLILIEVEVEKVVSTAEVTTASATTTTVDELTLAQTLIEIKAAKPWLLQLLLQQLQLLLQDLRLEGL